jgi:hypothetical protein
MFNGNKNEYVKLLIRLMATMAQLEPWRLSILAALTAYVITIWKLPELITALSHL